ncbi:MAG: hypothetical protein WA854_05955 [Candidatus Binataceae bacterium]|jgi:hypothetical protein
MIASDPAGAQVTTNDGRSGTTPYAMKVNRDDDLDIHISKVGYSPTDVTDASHVEWGYLISDIFFTGLIGLGVDGLDGAMFYHNQTMVTAHLDPLAAQAALPAPAVESSTARLTTNESASASNAIPAINSNVAAAPAPVPAISNQSSVSN